jgi:hypothetical protein
VYKSHLNCADCNLYCDFSGSPVHIGLATGYSMHKGHSSNPWRIPLYNLYLYTPLVKLYRLKVSELYSGYLQLVKDPYHVCITKFPDKPCVSFGSIMYQDQKLTKF